MDPTLFARRSTRALIGVVHLMPLPGSPYASARFTEVLARAVSDARALVDGGVDALIVENLGDYPFSKSVVAPYTVAAMTRVALALRDAAPNTPLGINVLRNDAIAALSVAAAAEASFIRVNVHTGAMVTDQGVIEGDARATLLERRRLGAPVQIAADVLVKHAAPLAPLDVAQLARDTSHRGGADALIVTGSGTGQAVDLERLQTVRDAAPQSPVWVGSGTTPERWEQLAPWIDAAIVGTYFHADGRLDAPIDPQRVRALRSCVR